MNILGMMFRSSPKTIYNSKNPGFKVEILNNATVLQYFKLFVANEIIDLIILET